MSRAFREEATWRDQRVACVAKGTITLVSIICFCFLKENANPDKSSFVAWHPARLGAVFDQQCHESESFSKELGCFRKSIY